MPSRWPWRRWTRQGSFFTMPTGERNDFGECFFGQVRLVAAARIRLPRRNPGEDVCRGQSSLTFSGTTSKSYARPTSVPVTDIAQIVYVSHAKQPVTWELTVSSPIRTGFRSGVGLCRGSATSALGQKQTFGPFIAMSALPPKADINGRRLDVCPPPKADMVWSTRTIGAETTGAARGGRELRGLA
jgi:hypothetical protein